MKQTTCKLLLAAFVAGLVLTAWTAWSQENSQIIPITPPSTRKVGPPSQNATAQELEDQGDQLRVEKEYLDSLDYFSAALKKLPPKSQEAAVIYNKMGIVKLQMTRFSDAKKDFEKSLKIDKKYAQADNNLAVVLYHQEKYGRAIKFYKRAIAINANDASFHSNLGSAYFSKKDMENAVKEYTEALRLDPEIFERRSQAGVILQMSSPKDRAHYSYVLAKMYAQIGQLDRSLLYLRRAIEEGYPQIDNVYKDTEFITLRKDPRFQELMKQPPPSIP